MGFFNSIVRVVPTGRKAGASVNKSAVFDTPLDAHTAANPTDYHSLHPARSDGARKLGEN